MESRPWHQSYDAQVPISMKYPEKPATFFLKEAVRKHPDQACTIFEGQEISYRRNGNFK